MQKTLSIRIDQEDYNFVKELASENKEEISKAVRELVDLGRLMFALENYKKKKISIGKAASLAGVSISEMLAIFAEFDIESNLEYDDYIKGLENLKKVW